MLAPPKEGLKFPAPLAMIPSGLSISTDSAGTDRPLRSRIEPPLELKVHPLLAMPPGHFISVIEDITRRKGAEALIKFLSPREIEVLEYMTQGRTNAEIAEDLGLSANTVKTHVKSIMDKLGVADRTEAAVYAVEMGLFTPRFRVPENLPRPAAPA